MVDHFYPMNFFEKQETISISERFENYKEKELDLSISSKDVNITKEELIKLCTFKNLVSLNLSGHHLKEIPEDFINLNQIEKLDLSRNDIINLSFLINLLKIKELNLKSNSLSNFPKEILKMNNLEKLDLSFNNIKQINFSFSILQKPKYPPLKSLNLNVNSLMKFPVKIIEFKTLQYLDLSKNRIGDDIPNDILKLNELKSLNLEECEMNKFPNEILNLEKLEKLYLSRNRIINIPEQLILLKNLKELYLNNCELKNIENIKNSQLKILHLNENKIYSFQNQLLELKELKIEKSELKEINFSGLLNLEYLFLSNNFIEKLDSSFQQLIYLKKLDLSFNKLKEISIEKLEEIEEIDLSNNFIEKLDSFKNLKKLNKFIMKNNRLKYLSNDIHETNIEQLDLTYNYIKEISKDILNIKSLKYLRLKHNDIDIIPNDIKNLINLIDFNLDHNGILELPDEITELKYLKYLFLSFNNPKGFIFNDTIKNWIEKQNIIISKEFEYCSKIQDGLYLSSAAAASNKHHLKELGITHIITVAHDIIPPHPDKFGYFIIYVEDVRSASLISHFDDVNKFVNEVKKKNGSLLIHCMAGVSRSATITCAILMYQNKWKVKNAFSHLHKSRNCVNPNDTFKKELKDYEKYLENDIQLNIDNKNYYEIINIKDSFLLELIEYDNKRFKEREKIKSREKMNEMTTIQPKKNTLLSGFKSVSNDDQEINF